MTDASLHHVRECLVRAQHISPSHGHGTRHHVAGSQHRWTQWVYLFSFHFMSG